MVGAAKQSATATATASAEIVPYTFDGDRLEVVREAEDVHVVVRRVCDALGIGFSRQLKKLKTDPSVCVVQKPTQLEGDDQVREVACISIRSLPLWLATIHPGKVKPSVRAKLIRYKRECADVLADHFLGPRQPANDNVRDLVEGLYLRIEELERRNAVAAMTTGVLHPSIVKSIGARVTELAMHRHRLGYSRSIESARTWINQRIVAAAQWSGSGCRRENMPADRYGMVDVCLTQLGRDLAAEERRRGVERRQGVGKSLVMPQKRAVQEYLFGNVPANLIDPAHNTN